MCINIRSNDFRHAFKIHVYTRFMNSYLSYDSSGITQIKIIFLKSTLLSVQMIKLCLIENNK